jgi:hypothetical protein
MPPQPPNRLRLTRGRLNSPGMNMSLAIGRVLELEHRWKVIDQAWPSKNWEGGMRNAPRTICCTYFSPALGTMR